MRRALGRDQAILGQMTADGVDDLRALAHQQIAGPEHDGRCLLGLALDGDEPHGRALGRLADCFGIRSIVLLPLDERLHVSRRDQPHLMPQLGDLACPVVSARARLHGDKTAGLRGEEGEHLIAPQGPSHVDQLIAQIEDPSSGIPDPARSCLAVLVETLRALQGTIAALDTEIAARAKRDDGARRLMSIPGIGPLIATAIEALAPPVETFRSGRDFAAWVGLTPLQRSTGAQERLGKISRMGERTLRRLLIIGASGVVRWARRKGVPAGSWLARMLARKPPMLVMVALANKMARIAWALIAKGGSYRAPAVAA